MSDLQPNKEETIASENKKNNSVQKSKKTRRGKKKPKSQARDKEEKNDTLPPDGDQNFPIWSPNDPDFSSGANNVVIRPIDAPKAPKNSTQFIIDDHNECHLYFNFEKPGSEPFTITSPSNDAAIVDVDYEYHPMQDPDTSVFYLNDFEHSYNNMRYEELMRLDSDKIISNLEQTDSLLLELEQKFCQKDPITALEQLQQKLLELQEENVMLQKANNQFKELLMSQGESHETETTDSVPRESESQSDEQLCNVSVIDSVEEDSEEQVTSAYTNGLTEARPLKDEEIKHHCDKELKKEEANLNCVCENENSGYLADISELVVETE